jgi:hypothetical protein
LCQSPDCSPRDVGRTAVTLRDAIEKEKIAARKALRQEAKRQRDFISAKLIGDIEASDAAIELKYKT